MRRKDRQITDPGEILKIIDKCDVCRLAMSRDNIPYIVPLNFGYAYESEKLTLYFHGAKEGKKLDILRQNPIACFEMDCEARLIAADEAARYSMDYQSVIGSGTVAFCEGKEETREALAILMKHYAPQRTFEFPDTVLDSVLTFRLEVSEFTGKQKGDYSAGRI